MHIYDQSDEVLATLLQQGDERAYEEIYRRHVVSLTGFVESKLYSLEDARDLIQELFVDLWSRRSSIAITGSISRYLFAAARHRIIDHIRKNLVKEQYAERMRQWSPAFRSLEEELDARELAADLAERLAELPEHLQRIYRLSREEGRSIQEIAERLQLSEQTVKNNISKILKYLRKTLRSLGVFLNYFL